MPRKTRKRGAGRQTRFSNMARVREFSNNNNSNNRANSSNKNSGNGNVMIPTKPNMSAVANPIQKNAKVPLMSYPYTQEDSHIIGELMHMYDTGNEMQSEVEKNFCVDLFGTEREMYDEIKTGILTRVANEMSIIKQKTADKSLQKRIHNKKVYAYTKYAISDIFSRLDIPQDLKPNIIKRLRCNLLVFQLKILFE